MLVSLPKYPRDARPVTAVSTSQIFRIPHPGWAAPWVPSSIRQPGSQTAQDAVMRDPQPFHD
jgi:hypothetical protein